MPTGDNHSISSFELPSMSHASEHAPLISSRRDNTSINAIGVMTAASGSDSSPCTLKPKQSQTTERARKALTGAIVFCFFFMIAEFAGGIYTHSLAVLNDAVHMITDVATLSLSLMAVHVSSWKSCNRYSYGWRRAEVVGALGSVFATWALVVWILVEAISRLVTIVNCARSDESDPGECFSIDAPVMLYIGLAGFCANVICACVLHWGGHHGHSHGSFGDDHGNGDEGHDDHHGHAHDDHSGHAHDDHDDHHGHSHDEDHHGHGHDDGHSCDSHGGHGNMNLRGAFLHVIGDCLQSLGVVLAAGIIWGVNNSVHGSPSSAHSFANIADPCCSMLFGVITMFTTINLFRDIFRVLMECTPKGFSVDELRKELLKLKNIADVRDLHVWSLGSEGAVMSAHLVLIAKTSVRDAKRTLHAAEDLCRKTGIDHTTIQLNHVVEGDSRCESSEDDDDHHGHSHHEHSHSHGGCSH